MSNYPLFEHMVAEHGLTLLESELEDIKVAAKACDDSLVSKSVQWGYRMKIYCYCGSKIDTDTAPTCTICGVVYCSDCCEGICCHCLEDNVNFKRRTTEVWKNAALTESA